MILSQQKDIIMHLLFKKCPKKFWMDFQPKILNFYMVLN
jgi:hypothetical protein